MIRLRPIATAAAGRVSLVCATNAVLNHVFVAGGSMLDTGWFAHLVAVQDWPPSNPPLIGGTSLATHLTLLVHALARSRPRCAAGRSSRSRYRRASGRP